ncbi:MAG: shikimate kinase [Pseudomonadota bacterium]|nr:shikimate kinase [Pseudomonadota bacterium]
MNAFAPLNRKTIALIGLMGVGKSSIGRRLASALAMPFKDADAEIEAAAGRSIADIFEQFGEVAFRDGERRVIARLLEEPPHVLATGGGAFDDPATQRLLAEKTVSVWLKADLEVLARRVGRRDTRPLIAGKDPLAVLEAQAADRYRVFALADITVETGDTAHHVSVDAIIKALAARAAQTPP